MVGNFDFVYWDIQPSFVCFRDIAFIFICSNLRHVLYKNSFNFPFVLSFAQFNVWNVDIFVYTTQLTPLNFVKFTLRSGQIIMIPDMTLLDKG
jgi:hypothetical protein